MEQRAAWACCVWIFSKLLLLIVLGCVASLIYKDIQTYNDAVTGLGADYSTHIVKMKYVVLGLALVGTLYGVFGIWFLWVFGAYAKYIRDNFILPTNVEINTILSENRNRQRVGMDLDLKPKDLGYLSGSEPRKAAIEPAPIY